MKKTLLLAGVACLFASQAMAFNINPYVSAKLKYSSFDSKWTTDSSDDFDIDDKVVGGSLAIGTEQKVVGGAFRLEAEFNQNADAEKNHNDVYWEEEEAIGNLKLKLKTKSIMLNGYFDIDTGTQFTPYVGAGVGVAWSKYGISGGLINGYDNIRELAWQVGAGVSYSVNSNVAIDLGYRYMDYGESSEYEKLFDENMKVETTAHEFYMGFRYNF